MFETFFEEISMRSTFYLRFTSLCFLLLLSITSWSAFPPFDGEGREMPSLAPLLEKVNSSVVNIATFTTRPVRQNPLMNDPFFRRFFNIPNGGQLPSTRRTQSAGSGVIIDAKNGTIVTNHHVVNGADEIVVSLADDREFKAELIGSDAEVDIAVLKLIDFDKLHDIPLANSEKLLVGDFVIAIGNPFGLGQTVTSGIVSALGRSGLNIEGYENFIQTDASINPGNSGGALVNLRGELIGINTAILAPAGGNVGIGFAIPINMAKTSIDQILEHGEVVRGQLGIMIQDLTRELAEAFDIGDQQRGVLIAGVNEGSSAEEAGVKAGDIVISLNGKEIKNVAQLRNQIGSRRIGDVVKLTVLRDGRTKIIKAKVGVPRARIASSARIHRFLDGATLEMSVDQNGVEITAVEQQSTAGAFGLMAGDVILSANRIRIQSMEHLKNAATKSDQRLLLGIKRGKSFQYLVLQ
ncbi:MAG: serine protease DegQ [Gammaproteobacteria bacterium]